MIGRTKAVKSRLSTSKKRTSHSQRSSYQQLEKRNLLATFVVTTTADIVADDGLVSLREAITAANTNQPFSDVQAGDETGDRIVFGPDARDRHNLDAELQIVDDLIIRGFENDLGNPTTLSQTSFAIHRLISIDTSERVYLRDFDLDLGRADQGGLVKVNDGGNVTFKNIKMSNGVADEGGAVHATNSRLVFDESRIDDNSATSGSGGGLWASGGEVLVLQSAMIGNEAVEGGAIYISNGTRLFANDAILNGNRAFAGGGGAAIWAGEDTVVQISDSILESNVADPGDTNSGPFDPQMNTRGGAIAAFGESLRVVDSRFVGSYASRGGAVYSTAKGSTFVETVFDSNQAIDDGGAGWFFSDDVRIVGGRVVFNSAADRGGGFSFGNSLPEVNKAVVKNVQFDSNTALFGGGVSGSGDVRIIDSSFSANVAEVPDDRAGIARGGAIETVSGNLLVLNSTFAGNMAKGNAAQGGAISSLRSSTYIGDSTFRSNRATDGGGGAISVISVGDVTVRSTLFEFNSAAVGGSVSVGGNATLRTFDSTFQSNIATNRGGAVQVVGTARYVSRGTAFDSNRTATGEGGAIFNHGTANIASSTFTNNKARRGGAIKVGGEIGTLSVIGQTEFTANIAEANGSAISSTSGSITLINDANFSSNIVEDGLGDVLFIGDVAFHRVTNSNVS